MSHLNYPALKRHLLAALAEEIRDRTPICHTEFSRVIEHYWCVDYQRAKEVINTLWRGYRKEMRPLFSTIMPEAPIEIDRCFREARGEEAFRFSGRTQK